MDSASLLSWFLHCEPERKHLRPSISHCKIVAGSREVSQPQECRVYISICRSLPAVSGNPGCFASRANSASYHQGLRILAACPDGRGSRSLCKVAPVVLAVVGLFHCERPIIEDSLLPQLTSGPGNELTTSLQPYTLDFIHQELISLDLAALESELWFCHSSHWPVADVSTTNDFPHGHTQILLDSRHKDIPVPGSVDDAGLAFLDDRLPDQSQWTTWMLLKRHLYEDRANKQCYLDIFFKDEAPNLRYKGL